MHAGPGYFTEKQAIQTQTAASTEALESVALLLLDHHLQHCLTHAEGPEDTRRKLAEASEAIADSSAPDPAPQPKEHR